MPSVPFGSPVGHLPKDLAALYEEARNCCSVAAFNSSVMTCRKILMHIAAQHGAEEGKSFVHYVDHLFSKGYIPPNSKGWVDHIREKGNEANHEITLMGEEEAKELLSFTEMLLRILYELPNKVPKPKAT